MNTHNQQQSAYGIYISYLDDYLKELGEDSAYLLKGAGIDDVSAIQQGQRIPLAAMAHACERVYRHPNLPGFFLEYGARVPVTAHGILGLALLSAKDMAAVLNLFARYSDIALPNLRVAVVEEEEQTIIEFTIHSPFGDFNTALGEAMAVNIYQSLMFLVSKNIPLIGVDFIHPAPSYKKQYSQYFIGEINFNQAANRIRLPRDTLHLPITTANDLNFRLMVQQCDIELENIYSSENLVERIKGMIATDLDNGPSIGSIASRLSVSERTLRRRLSEESICFRDLLKSVRHEMAIYYLRDRNYRIEQIAIKTGYRDTASFRNAFKKQTGLSPLNWRKRMEVFDQISPSSSSSSGTSGSPSKPARK